MASNVILSKASSQISSRKSSIYHNYWHYIDIIHPKLNKNSNKKKKNVFYDESKKKKIKYGFKCNVNKDSSQRYSSIYHNY